jgi:hypothetical protein
VSEKHSFRITLYLALVGFVLAILVVTFSKHDTMMNLLSARKQKRVMKKKSALSFPSSSSLSLLPEHNNVNL